MKKKIVKIIASAACAACAAAALAGCSGSSGVGFAGSYWNVEPSQNAVVAVYEKTTYDVSSVTTSEFSSSELTNADLSFDVDSKRSSYETELSVEDGRYVYKTRLTIYGTYTYADGKTFSVEGDVTETEVRFGGLDETLAPVKTTRTARNVFPRNVRPSSEEDFVTAGYTATVEYGDSAELVFTPDEDSVDKFNVGDGVFRFDGYRKKTFFDDSMMVFAFRAMDYARSFSYSFDTLDIGSRSVKSVTCASLTSGNSSDPTVTPMTIKAYTENGSLTNDKTFSTYGVKFSTSGTYGQTFRYAYYAANPKDEDGKEAGNPNRHRAVKIYQPMIFNAGYLCFTLNEVRTVR